MTSEIEKSLEKNWVWDEGDPEVIHILEEEIASGSFGSVYKVRNFLQETVTWRGLFSIFLRPLFAYKIDHYHVSSLKERFFQILCQELKM